MPGCFWYAAICLQITATDEWGNRLDHSYYGNDEDGDGGHTVGGEKMVMVALRNPSKCLWTLKLFKPTLERRQAATQQQCILGNAVHSGEKLGV